MERFAELTKAIVSIGGWKPADSTVAAAISNAEYEEGIQLGVCAEVCGIQLDGQGEPMQTALSERKVIDRAKGILMKLKNIGEADAYAMLRKTAMNENKKIAEVAQSVVTAAELLK